MAIFRPKAEIYTGLIRIELYPERINNFKLIPFPHETHSSLKKSRISFLRKVLDFGKLDRKLGGLYAHEFHVSYGGDLYVFTMKIEMWSTDNSHLNPIVLTAFEPAYALI